MSNQCNNTAEYLQDVRARFTEALAARRYSQALIWVDTASVLEGDKDWIEPSDPVNMALFQLIYDTVCDSENLVLKCGNVTTAHGDWLRYGREANELLVSRFRERAPDEARALTVVLQGHFDALFAGLDRHLNPQATVTVTSGAEARLLLHATRTIRRLIAGYDSIKITARDMDIAQRAKLLDACVESPDYEVFRFPLRFLNNWDKALFFIEGAQGILAEIKAMPACLSQVTKAMPLTADNVALVASLTEALASAGTLTSQKSKLAKRSYRRISDLGKQLAAVLIG